MFKKGLPLLLVLCWISLSGQSRVLDKCSPVLRLQLGAARTPANERELYVLQVGNLPAFTQLIDSSNVRVLHEYAPSGLVLVACAPAYFWDTLLPRPDLLFADLGQLLGKEEIIVPGHNLSTNLISTLQSRRPDLNGAGTVISVKEFQFDPADVDFKNRVVPNVRQNLDIRVHAALMATLAAGAANADPAGGGVARGSSLVSSSFEGLMPDDAEDYTHLGITVQNHSYGSPLANYYGAQAQAYDQTFWDHPELIHVFSSGNEGLETASTGVYTDAPGFANLTGNYKMAKNIITVGATDSFSNIVPFSSKGPAYDGRLKPDLVAFGPDGTSSAAALVSGAAAVIRQVYEQQYGIWPSSAIVKAILLGSADDTGIPGPDFTGGYGLLNLVKAVDLVESRPILSGEVQQGETKEWDLNPLPNGTKDLRITLHWNDLPALPNAPKALINDLDLQVVAPDGSVVYPMVGNPFPHPDSLSLPAQPYIDTLNNTEQVWLSDPMPGTYKVVLKGKKVLDTQSFAIAVYWDTLSRLEWVSPVKKDPFPSGREVVLRWSANTTASKGQLEWRPVGTETWAMIDSSLDIRQGFRRWTTPDVFTAAQVRIRFDLQTVVSDTFLITPALRLQIGFNCPDSVLLYWNKTGDDARYRLWGLGDRYLEPLLMTVDTQVVLQKNSFGQTRFAVSCLDEQQYAESPVSPAPDIATQAAGCFINNLLAQVNTDGHIELTLELGTLFGIQKVYIDKWVNDTWQVLADTAPVGLTILTLDKNTFPGIHTYRPRLFMNNGGTVTGEQVAVSIAGKGGWVFPNPAVFGEIRILFEPTGETLHFVLRDFTGKRLTEKILYDTLTDLQLPAFPPGCYGWEVINDTGARLSAGKIVIIR